MSEHKFFPKLLNRHFLPGISVFNSLNYWSEMPRLLREFIADGGLTGTLPSISLSSVTSGLLRWTQGRSLRAQVRVICEQRCC